MDNSHLARVALAATTMAASAMLPSYAGDSSVVAPDNLLKHKVVATIPVGRGPLALVASPDSDFVYVANFVSNDISIIDTITNRVEATTIHIGMNQRALAITPDGKYLYVVNGGNVSVIQTSNRGLVTTLTNVSPSGGSPAISPDGSLAYFPSVAGFNSGQIAVVRTSDNKVLDPIPLESGASAVVFTGDGQYAYASLPQQRALLGSLSIIETFGRTVVGSIPVRDPTFLTISPDGHTLAVAHRIGPHYTVVDTSTNRVTAHIMARGAHRPAAFTPDGKYFCILKSSETYLEIVSLATDTIVGHTRVGAGPVDVAIIPNGKYAYVCNYSDNTVSVIDVSTF